MYGVGDLRSESAHPHDADEPKKVTSTRLTKCGAPVAGAPTASDDRSERDFFAKKIAPPGGAGLVCGCSFILVAASAIFAVPLFFDARRQ